MKFVSGKLSVVIAVLILAACMAGCTEEAPADTTITPTSTVTVATLPPTTVITTATSATTTITTVPTTKITTVVTTATTAVAPAPKVTDITPDKGTAGTSVSITALTGKNFVSGANVTLKKAGETGIVATNVVVSSSNLITCTFVLPSGAELGFWDVIITNPDGQSNAFQNGFYVTEGSTTTTTSSATATTTAVPSGWIKITQLKDTSVYAGGKEKWTIIGVIGTNLTAAKNMIATKGSDKLTGSDYASPSYGESQASFTFPAGSSGTWTITLVDSSGTLLATAPSTFEVL